MGVRIDWWRAPRRTLELDFGARIRIIERSVPLAFRILAVQGAFAAALAMMFLLIGRAHAMSALLAGIVVIAPNVGFAWRVAKASAPIGQELNSARRLIGSMIAKLLLSIGLLVVAFAYFRPEPVAFFATMIVLQAVYLLTPVLELR
jgi:F0F1-type ATP synthase assembly protein I